MMKFHKLLKPKPAPFFMFGLLISYNLMENWLNSTMMDYLTESLNSERGSAMVRNMQDGLSCLFVVIAYLMSEAYTGSFTAISFCASASTMGSMLFWISSMSDRKYFEYYMVIVAIALLTMGNIAGKCLSQDFFDSHLEEIARAKKEELGQQSINNNARLYYISVAWTIFLYFCSFGAVVICSVVAGDNPWHGIRFVSPFMVGTYMLFYFGYAWYNHEDLLPESNVGKFCRVCKAAYRKRILAYLTTEDGYYWKNYKQGHLYEANHGQDRVVRLLPRVPWGFGWLEKAAIIGKKQTENDDVSPHMQETKGELCTVKQVREAKSIVLLLCWGFCLFPYSFVAASGNTFFVSQASSLKIFMLIDISYLFLLKTTMTSMVIPMLFLIVEEPNVAKKISKIIIKFGANRKIIDSTTVNIGIMSTKALIPQFLLLGVAEALVEGKDGLSRLFENYASESVRNFAEPFSNLVIGLGKLLSIPWFLIFDRWLYKSNNTASRHLDKYFLMLAILNIVSLIGFSFYYYMFVHDNEFPEDEERRRRRRRRIRRRRRRRRRRMMEQIVVDDGLESDFDDGANGVERNSATNQGPEVPEEDKEIEMEQISEHDHEIEPISEHATREEHLTTIFEGDSNLQNNGVLLVVVESNEA
ncbi:protein NRT1/ PTR FAMILY 5.4-like [Arachis stenosperma]|uniref:protein NRT1/ PTR FAMILY 5.4-like n=1 Tax=Arachis stenosperma TaxID=217475 RepID=UPI0025AC906A|nr:protein NRT1/ PTR FAMILY 5.4-like [Arachis stenosperma]